MRLVCSAWRILYKGDSKVEPWSTNKINGMKGISYYPMDVNFLDDTKFGFIDAKFGAEGVVIILRLWQLIYNDKGYYCEWDEDQAVLFARRYGYGKKGNEVQSIVEEALKRGIFNKTMYDQFGILTSRRIQDVYREAVKRRSSCEIKSEYNLISTTSGTKNCMQKEENCMQKEENCQQGADKTSKNADNFSQNKINKNKINNTPPLSNGESGSAEGERGRILKDLILKSDLSEDDKSEALRLSDDGDERTCGGMALMMYFDGLKKGSRFTFENYLSSLLKREAQQMKDWVPKWSYRQWEDLNWIKSNVPASQGAVILERLENDKGLYDIVSVAISAIKKASGTKNPILLPGEFIMARMDKVG